SRQRLRRGVCGCQRSAPAGFRIDSRHHSQSSSIADSGEGRLKITEIRTRVVEWRGKTVPPQPHFCTNAMDLLELPADSMAGFRFHGWLVVEMFTDAGHVGVGNAALSPRITKQVIDTYLKPILIGKNPFDYEFLWQNMYRQTMAFGR